MKKIGQNKVFGSLECYNRVLYGGHSKDYDEGRFFTFAGDAPIFMGASSDYTKDTWCYQAKNGTLMSGVAMTPGHVEDGAYDLFSKWFHDCEDIVAEWHHGYMSYKMTQFSPWVSAIENEMEVYPLCPDDGFLVHYKIQSEQRILFCAAFGGITPFFGRFEYHVSPRRDYSVADCENNRAEVFDGYAVVSGPGNVKMLIGCDFDCEYSTDSPDAMSEAYPSMFLTPHAGNKCIVKICRELEAGKVFEGNLLVLKDASPEKLKSYLDDKDLVKTLKTSIRSKYSAVSISTPDETLDSSIRDTMIALDASFHGRSFYHGAIGYHAPFLGWRGWYAPALLGWADRVKSAVKSHFDTMLHSDLPEKVWWDGGDRPDLDHEGTQYHHLENTSGRLTALLHRDDIYDMQEVAIDMTLYYFEQSGDMETCAAVYDRLSEALDWQERILDPDGDGMYQNFLNTWISDGHSYNGAACAQASSYNYRANLAAAKLGKVLGRDVSKLEKRANAIQTAFQKNFWQQQKGVVAESIDTIGNKLVHDAPELSTIYLASECGNVDAVQAYRMLKWVERNIKCEKTLLRGGKLYYSSNWKPKKYSTEGLFPAENAALALAYFQNGQSEKAMEIINALLDAFDLSPNPGSIRHVISAQGGTDHGDIDFTDVSGCYLRMMIEGLWGVRFDLPQQEAYLSPQLPPDWREASLSLPGFSIVFSRKERVDSYSFTVENDAKKIITLPLVNGEVEDVFLNGGSCRFAVIPGFEKSFVRIISDKPGKNDVQIYYGKTPRPELTEKSITAFAGNMCEIRITNGEITNILDFSGLCSRVSGDADSCVVRINDVEPGIYDLAVEASGAAGKIYLPLEIKVCRITANNIDFEIRTQNKIDISRSFNMSLTEIHNREFRSPRPENYSIGMRLNGRYAWEWNHYGHNALVVDDAKLRNCGGVITSKSGIGFLTPAEGDNCVTVSLWDNFPTTAEIPVNAGGSELAVLLCGTTHAMQSYVVNGRLTVVYDDGTLSETELTPPVNFDDFLLGSYQTGNETLYFSDGTHGIVARIRLDDTKTVKALRVTAVANEVIINIIGITVLS